MRAGRVEGLVAIVTGGAAGLGKADAELLVEEGASVVITDIDAEAGEAVAARLGERATFLYHDVTDEARWQEVVRETEQRLGRVDILVNNAGIVIVANIEETSLAEFRRVNSVMNEGVFLGCKTVIPAMVRSGGGSIINMSSTAAYLGFQEFLAYSAAKGAVRSMTKSVAMYCQNRNYGIRCNSVHPSTMETPMVQFAEGRVGQELPVKEGVLPADAIGAPRDVAELVVFLASPASRFITGEEILIDNGLTKRP